MAAATAPGGTRDARPSAAGSAIAPRRLWEGYRDRPASPPGARRRRLPGRPAGGTGAPPPAPCRRERASDLDQALAHRVQHGLGAVVDPQLLVHVADVVADGLLADLESVGDLLVGHPAGQELQDLDLPAGEPV